MDLKFKVKITIHQLNSHVAQADKFLWAYMSYMCLIFLLNCLYLVKTIVIYTYYSSWITIEADLMS